MRRKAVAGEEDTVSKTEMFRVNLAIDLVFFIDVPLASSSISLLRRGRLHFFSPLIATMMMIRITIDSPALLRLRSLLRWCLFGGDDR